MKALLINKYLYRKGGDAICTLATGELLLNNGHDICCWGMGHPDNPEYPYEHMFVDYVDLVNGGGLRQQIKTAANILYSLEAKRKIQKLINIIQPDIVHLNNFAHQISPSILHVFKKYNLPSVMTLHDYKLICPAYTMLNNGKLCEKCKGGRYYHCVLNKCTKGSYAKSLVAMLEMYLHHKLLHIYDLIDVFISPSAFLKEKVKEMGFNREVIHLPNFVDLTDFQPKYQGEENSIVYFGRLSPEKGLLTLLKAVKGLDVQLKIIGDGPLKQELENKVSTENMSNVEFLGYRSGDELQGIIKNCIATITPSQCYENNPRTVIESFALGKPVIGTNIGGIPELVIDGRTGYTFEPGNPDDLRIKIKQLLKDPGKIIEMGKKARTFVETEFSSERHYDQLLNIYDMAIDKKHSRRKGQAK